MQCLKKFPCLRSVAIVYLEQNHHRLAITLLPRHVRSVGMKFSSHTSIQSQQLLQVVNHIPWHIRGFHSSPRRNIHPGLWLLLKPILNVSAALTGRSVRKWYQRLDSKEKRSFWSSMKAKWPVWAGIGASIGGFLGYYYVSHIEETPITSRKRFVALTHDQVALISETEAKNIIETYKDSMNGPNQIIQNRRVLSVMVRLDNANPELHQMKFDHWKVYVINEDIINACVLPTGHVFVFEGMLKLANTQDQLAVVLGHEMAHALLEHSVEELSYAQLIDYVIILFMAAIWCIIPSNGISFITQWFHKKIINLFTHLPHSRSIEREADKVGTMLAARACYDVREGSVMWRKMDSLQKIKNEDFLPEWMSTHPDNVKRAEFIDFMVPQAEKWRDGAACPKWPNADPRKAMEILSKKVDDHLIAQKTGQNLKRVKLAPKIGIPSPKLNLQASTTPETENQGSSQKIKDDGKK